ncbi:MAG: hypothetical protein OHK0023_15660 [Anaerolineae bacterium]
MLPNSAYRAQFSSVLNNRERLAKLESLEILDTPAEASFDRLTKLASRIIGAPVSLISLVTHERQFFKSFVGLPEPWASQRQVDLDCSFCQYVVATGKPLIIEDLSGNPLVANNPLASQLNVAAYIGMPLKLPSQENLGSFCVIDSKPREWQPHEIEIMHELGALAVTELELRAELVNRKRIEAKLQLSYDKLHQQMQRASRVTEFCRSTIDHLIVTTQRNAPREETLKYLFTAQRELDRLS